MNRQSNSKGLLPNGPKIKELRKRHGLSQKDLIAKSTLQLHNIQRAERVALHSLISCARSPDT
jgi:transcriptional regulator with XRE-family HTH domain